jgi:hypothetical protein
MKLLEKREILRLLEPDKPLPDNYRFLLFDDKRDVDLYGTALGDSFQAPTGRSEAMSEVK